MGAADWNNEEFDAKIAVIKGDIYGECADLSIDAIQHFLGEDVAVGGYDLSTLSDEEKRILYGSVVNPEIHLALRIAYFEKTIGTSIGRFTINDFSCLSDPNIVRSISTRFEIMTPERIELVLDVVIRNNPGFLQIDFDGPDDPDDSNTPPPPSVA